MVGKLSKVCPSLGFLTHSYRVQMRRIKLLDEITNMNVTSKRKQKQ